MRLKHKQLPGASIVLDSITIKDFNQVMIVDTTDSATDVTITISKPPKDGDIMRIYNGGNWDGKAVKVVRTPNPFVPAVDLTDIADPNYSEFADPTHVNYDADYADRPEFTGLIFSNGTLNEVIFTDNTIMYIDFVAYSGYLTHEIHSGADTGISDITGLIDALAAKVAGPASSTDNAIARFDGTTGKVIQDSSVTVTDAGNLGIGTVNPTARLGIKGSGATSATSSLTIKNSSNVELFKVQDDGAILVNGVTTILPTLINGVAGTVSIGSTNTTNTGDGNQNYGTNAGASRTTGTSAIAQGAYAGYSNTTGSNWIAQGAAAGRYNTTGNSWIAQGFNAGYSNTTGNNWIAQGLYAGYSNTTGSNWIAQGVSAGYSNTTGNSWIAQGFNAGYSNTTGNNWIAQGLYAGYSNTTGSNWIAQGLSAGYSNTTGSNWIAQGVNAGRYTSTGDLTVANNTIHIGYNSKSLADNATNEIVIGAYAVGNGDNTVTLGDSAITGTYLHNPRIIGNVGIGTTTPTSKLQVVGLPTYANNTAALAAGLTAGAFYRTSTGVLMVTY